MSPDLAVCSQPWPQDTGDQEGGQAMLAAQTPSMPAQEVVVFDKLKWFCSCLVNKLVPPLLKEVQASALRLEVEPFTPRRTTRATKRAPQIKHNNASPAENVIVTALGLAPQDMDVDEATITELQQLFDSPLRAQHVRIIAALFGKEMPTSDELRRERLRRWSVRTNVALGGVGVC